MVIPGSECKDKSSSEEIAKKTLDCLKKNVPTSVPGIAFLSGGQSEIESSKNLNEIKTITSKYLGFKSLNTIFSYPAHGDASGVRGAALLVRKNFI